MPPSPPSCGKSFPQFHDTALCSPCSSHPLVPSLASNPHPVIGLTQKASFASFFPFVPTPTGPPSVLRTEGTAHTPLLHRWPGEWLMNIKAAFICCVTYSKQNHINKKFLN